MHRKSLLVSAIAAASTSAMLAVVSSPGFAHRVTERELAELFGGQGAPCQCVDNNSSCNTADCVRQGNSLMCMQCRDGSPYANCVSCPAGVMGLTCDVYYYGENQLFCGTKYYGAWDEMTMACEPCTQGSPHCVLRPNDTNGKVCPAS